MIHHTVPLAVVTLLLTALALSGCKEEIGCTERTADNYNPDAVRDDGSCINARDKFLGVYSLLHIQWNGGVRDSFPNAADPTPRYMTITEDHLREEMDDIKILNFGKDSITIRALVSRNFITIPMQNINTRGIPMTYEGEGHIDDSGYLTILYQSRFFSTGQVDCDDCVIFAQRLDN